MSSLPESDVEEKILREHVERARYYTGTLAAYCREQNIDYDKFMYCRWRQSGGPSAKSAARAAAAMKLKTSKLAKRSESAGFAQVSSAQAPTLAKAKVEVLAKQLPDAKWLAEFIHNLMRGER